MAHVAASALAVLLGLRAFQLRKRNGLRNEKIPDVLCLDDIEALGKAALPAHVVDYYSYTCGSGQTAKSASSAYDAINLMTRVMAGIAGDQVDTSTTILGEKLAVPIMIAPTAFHRLPHDDGEVATAKAAAASSVNYVYSFMLSNCLADDVSSSSKGPKWAHLYILKDREYVKHIVREAERLGFNAIVVTCDHPHEGVKRHTLPAFERNEEALIRGVKLRDRMRFPNADKYRAMHGIPHNKDIGENDGTLTWKDIEWLVSLTDLPVICKGILSPHDAVLAAQHGAAGIVVSNHGGRQTDTTPPSIQMLPHVVRALRDYEEKAKSQQEPCLVLIDSGIRKGSHVLKAIALGARAVLIGRPVLWGLAFDGQRGVQKVLSTLRQELMDDMACAGCGCIEDISDAIVYSKPNNATI